MKTKLELATVIYDYLNMISEGYENGDFTPLYPYLAEDCVLESQWVKTSNVGYDAVVSYLSGKGETLKITGLFPTCSIQELVGNATLMNNVDVNVNGERTYGTVGFYYQSGELCLLMEQTIDNKKNGVLLRIQLNEDEKISRISLCMPELFEYREFYTYVQFYPCIGDDEIDMGKIRISESYYIELYFFIYMVGESFGEYDNLHIPMEKWIKALEQWKRFYSHETFDEAFEEFCGVDYNNFTVKDEEVREHLSYDGNDLWNNRIYNAQMLDGLIEWTDKYKDKCDYINTYGF